MLTREKFWSPRTQVCNRIASRRNCDWRREEDHWISVHKEQKTETRRQWIAQFAEPLRRFFAADVTANVIPLESAVRSSTLTFDNLLSDRHRCVVGKRAEVRDGLRFQPDGAPGEIRSLKRRFQMTVNARSLRSLIRRAPISFDSIAWCRFDR